MTIDMDDEILQDFLVEAGEILEQLNEQLVDLEQQPDDYDLLNAVFRGFHTIKGGAGFLNIDPLVEVCHRAEDVFNVLRQGQRQVDAALMDAVLQVLDVVNEMFSLVQSGDEPTHADSQLLARLTALAKPQDEVEPEPVAETDAAVTAAPAQALQEMIDSGASERPAAPFSNEENDEITEEEFEALLDQLSSAESAANTQTAPETNAEDITEEEFEALLDELHGKGKFKTSVVEQPIKSAETTSDEITEDEFEDLLDDLHGKGKFTGMPKASKTPESANTPAPQIATTPIGQSGSTESQTPEGIAPTKQVPPKKKIESPKEKAAESKKAPAKSGETTVRVDTARLDDIMNMVGELVLVRNRLATLKARLGDEEVANAVANLDVVTADLQNSVMKTRMQPVKKVFGRFPRVIRDLARNLNKEIDLEMYGEDTDLDKNLVEALSDPMVHLVRNAVDHGIELPEEREKVGKPRRGKVVLSAAQEGDHILLSITDDGRGMDPEVLRRKAVEKGMMDSEAAARLDNKDCYNLIFQAGFSTKTEISDVSGRGVGMDVVKTRIAQMNGTVEIDSQLGEGSQIIIKLPLTLAILPTLMVVLGNQPFALPLASVVEIFNLNLDRTNVVDGQLTIMVRERALPLFYLRKWLVKQPIQSEHEGYGHVVVVNVSGRQVGLVVDHLVGQEEVVIKPLGAMLQGLDGMAGATITGDGKIAMILDVPGLMRRYAHH